MIYSNYLINIIVHFNLKFRVRFLSLTKADTKRALKVFYHELLFTFMNSLLSKLMVLIATFKQCQAAYSRLLIWKQATKVMYLR